MPLMTPAWHFYCQISHVVILRAFLGIFLRGKCIYISGSCPPSHSQSSLRNTISSYLQALKPKVKIAGGKELIYREGETATIFAEVPSEPAANEIRDCSQKCLEYFCWNPKNVRSKKYALAMFVNSLPGGLLEVLSYLMIPRMELLLTIAKNTNQNFNLMQFPENMKESVNSSI